MVDLNNIKKPVITKEAILKHIEPFAVFSYYINDEIIVGKPMSSPFRKDNIPSFGIFKKGNQYLYNDFVLGGGDIFAFVKYLFGYESFYDVCSRIAIDFHLDHLYICNRNMIGTTYNKKIDNDIKPIIQDKVIDLKVRSRLWKKHDKEFWVNNGINKYTLNKYNVFPISHIIMKIDGKRDFTNVADKYAYSFLENKDNKLTMKIYQPFSKYKWINSHDTSVWQGWTQLPKENDYLIITKSLKDVMSIDQNTVYPAVSLQQENAKAKDNVMKQIKERFENIFVFYDNDFDKQTNWGKKFGKEFADTHGLKSIFIPDEYKCKDFTDLVNKKGIEESREILNKMIMEHFNPPF